VRRTSSAGASTALLIVTLVACGGGDDASGPDTAPGTVANTAPDTVPDTVVAVPLPVECVTAPYSIVFERTGSEPAGSPSFAVVDAVALPIPIVPDPDGTGDQSEALAEAATTDLLGYSLIVADEPIDDGEIGLFGGYEPSEGRQRGFVSIFPSSPTPLAAGDVVVPGEPDELELFTTINLVGLDLKAAPDENNSYLDQAEGSVTVLAITPQALCLDVDLVWATGDGELTMRGVVTGRMLERSRLPLG
jgi:hypothetical protein